MIDIIKPPVEGNGKLYHFIKSVIDYIASLAFNDDDQGNEASLVVKKMLPQARRIAANGLTWNKVFEKERWQQQEMLEGKQRSRGFSR